MFLNSIERLFAYRFPMLSAGAGSGGGAQFNDESEDDDLDDIPEDLLLDADDDDPEDSDADDDNPEDEGEGGGQEKKVFTQEELDEIVQERLAREKRKATSDSAEEQRQAAIKKQQEDDNRYLQKIYDDEYKFLIDQGFDESSAKDKATREAQREQRIMLAERALRNQDIVSRQTQLELRYSQQKADAIGREPLLARYSKEIDEFARANNIYDFEVAADVIIGKKTRSGEITKNIRASEQQRTLKNVEERKKTRVEGSSQAGGSGQGSLTREQKAIARALGLTNAEYASGMKKSKR